MNGKWWLWGLLCLVAGSAMQWGIYFWQNRGFPERTECGIKVTCVDATDVKNQYEQWRASVKPPRAAYLDAPSLLIKKLNAVAWLVLEHEGTRLVWYGGPARTELEALKLASERARERSGMIVELGPPLFLPDGTSATATPMRRE